MPPLFGGNMKKYIYKENEYTSLYSLRDAVWKQDHIVFSTPSTKEGWAKYGITVEEIVPPELSLEELKERALKELNSNFSQARSSKRIYVDSSLGFPVNAGETAVIDVMMLTQQAQDQSEDYTVMFRAFDDTFHQVNLAQLKVLQNEIATEGSLFYQHKWNIQKQIDEATTKEELRSIDLTFPDTISLGYNE